jgi:hypothetical protein
LEPEEKSMRSIVLTAVALVGLRSGSPAAPVQGQPAPPKPAQETTAYSFKGDACEACECEAPCPCVWTKDASFTECRGAVVWSITSGSYGKTDLKGVAFALTVTKSAQNMVKSMGKWEGVLYVADTATAEQRGAVESFVKGKWGGVFAKLDTKSAPIATKIDGDRREVAIGKISTIKISPLKNPDGTSPVIEHPPFSLYPVLHCAKADVHTYKDAAEWDFSGRNAFFGPFEYANGK